MRIKHLVRPVLRSFLSMVNMVPKSEEPRTYTNTVMSLKSVATALRIDFIAFISSNHKIRERGIDRKRH
jgi:hypothetical protein